MTQGYYSLIQYCPDFSRAEAANVGVLLFQPEPRLVAVRAVEDVRPALKRLGKKADLASLRSTVRSMVYRIGREGFTSLEELEKFVRTRGNQIQLTMPRSARIENIEMDAERMFAELVNSPQPARPDVQKEIPRLLQVFSGFLERAPDRVAIDRDFPTRTVGIPIHADYAYKNGHWNLVREMPHLRSSAAVRSAAIGLCKEGEMVRDLVDGEGSLIVVATRNSKRSTLDDGEREFGEVLGKLKGATFVPSDQIDDFTRKVEEDLVSH